MSEEVKDKKEKKADPIAERKAKEIKEGFLNPFGEGVSYEEFAKAVKDAKCDVADYCKGHLDEDQLKWLLTELKHFENNKK